MVKNVVLKFDFPFFFPLVGKYEKIGLPSARLKTSPLSNNQVTAVFPPAVIGSRVQK